MQALCPLRSTAHAVAGRRRRIRLLGPAVRAGDYAPELPLGSRSSGGLQLRDRADSVCC